MRPARRCSLRRKAWTRERDRLAEKRRALPWVLVDKNYVFDGAEGLVASEDRAQHPGQGVGADQAAAEGGGHELGVEPEVVEELFGLRLRQPALDEHRGDVHLCTESAPRTRWTCTRFPRGMARYIVVSAEDSSQADTIARRIGQKAPKVEGMAVFGPAPAPLAMLRGRHRQRLLVHAARSLDVQEVIREWLAEIEWSPKVRVSVDIDPYSFL